MCHFIFFFLCLRNMPQAYWHLNWRTFLLCFLLFLVKLCFAHGPKRAHCLCMSHLIPTCCNFGICHQLTDIWTFGRCFFYWAFVRCSNDAPMGHGNFRRPWKFHSFLRTIFSRPVMYSVTVRCCEGTPCFCNFWWCITVIWVLMYARCWGVSQKYTVWTTIKML